MLFTFRFIYWGEMLPAVSFQNSVPGNHNNEAKWAEKQSEPQSGDNYLQQLHLVPHGALIRAAGAPFTNAPWPINVPVQ